jgi:hypothetical protein
MFKFILIFIILACIFSCGKVPNESWVMDNNGVCNEVDMSYGRLSLYHFNNQNDCHYVYDMNDYGFLVDKYFECDYGSYGIYRFFRTKSECLSF